MPTRLISLAIPTTTGTLGANLYLAAGLTPSTYQAAAKKALREFTLARMLRKTEMVYHEVLGLKRCLFG